MSEAIEFSHPPDVLMRILDPTLRLALRAPVVGPALTAFMVIDFTGRKTGRRLSVLVSAHHLDGDLYALLNAKWKYNFCDGATADVLHAGKTTLMHGQLVAEPVAVADIAHRIASAYGAQKAQRSMGLAFHGGDVPSVETFAAAAQRLGLAAIRLTPAS